MVQDKLSVKDALDEAAKGLAMSDVPDAEREAALLLALALGRGRTFIIAHPEYELSADEMAKFRSFVARRMSREPYQYISGNQEFFGLDFAVSPAVLIPRPETEILVETAIAELGKIGGPTIFCEIGVGSGCISVSILHNVPGATASAFDVSPAAVQTARLNSITHGVDHRLRLAVSDLFAAAAGCTFDMVVSNPPYVAAVELSGLQPEVRDHEPHIALTDGADGLSTISAIIGEAPGYLKPGGVLLLEVGFDQSEKVSRKFAQGKWLSVEMIRDLQRIPRVVKAVYGGN